MNKTGIEYLDFTWNPIAMRCTPVSEACANCWHLNVADRLAKRVAPASAPQVLGGVGDQMSSHNSA